MRKIWNKINFDDDVGFFVVVLLMKNCGMWIVLNELHNNDDITHFFFKNKNVRMFNNIRTL